ncbi:hypothetical protein [Natronospora cellulosivora (SeqCode)]
MFENIHAKINVHQPYKVGVIRKKTNEFLSFNKDEFDWFLEEYRCLCEFESLHKTILQEHKDSKEKQEILKKLVTDNKRLNKFLYFINNIDVFTEQHNKIVMNEYMNIYISSERMLQNGYYNPEKVKKYNPLEVDDLYIKLANINEYDYTSLICFYNNYGLINDSLANNTYNLFGDTFSGSKDHYYTLIHNLSNLRICIALYSALSDNALSEHITRIEDKKEIYYKEILLNKYIYQDFNSIYSEDNKTIIKYAITSLINREVNKISPSILIDNNNNFFPTLKAVSVLPIAYYQLYKLVFKNISLNECLHCGKPIHPNSSSPKYCKPPLSDPSDKSKCKGRHEQMVGYYREKILTNIMTIEEIEDIAKSITWSDNDDVKHTGRPTEEVLGWIRNYNPKSKKRKQLLKKFADRNDWLKI